MLKVNLDSFQLQGAMALGTWFGKRGNLSTRRKLRDCQGPCQDLSHEHRRTNVPLFRKKADETTRTER